MLEGFDSVLKRTTFSLPEFVAMDGSMHLIYIPVLLTRWAEYQKQAGVPKNEFYSRVFLFMSGLLLIGLISNLMLSPVDSKHHYREES